MALALTTLANAEAWIGELTPGLSSATDAIVQRFINSASGAILAYLNRPNLLPAAYVETRDGTGGPRLMLRNWPVLSVSALTIDGKSVLAGTYSGTPSPSSDGWAGYFFSAWDGFPPGRRVNLEIGGALRFLRGMQNVSVSYKAGYQVTNEAATVSAGSVTTAQPYGIWGSDGGVTYADGTALTATTGSPAVGQYQVDATTTGKYNFNSADDGEAVLITYGFIPSVIEDACCQLVAERYNYRQRIGMRSKAAAGETTGFDRSPIPPEITAMLASYRSVAPV